MTRERDACVELGGGGDFEDSRFRGEDMWDVGVIWFGIREAGRGTCQIRYLGVVRKRRISGEGRWSDIL